MAQLRQRRAAKAHRNRLSLRRLVPERRRRTMKGVVFPGDRKVEYREFPDPTPGPDEVVLEIKASGMCGSDLKFYRAASGGAANLGFSKGIAGPIIRGHEPCGVVVAVGKNVSPKQARIGQR